VGEDFMNQAIDVANESGQVKCGCKACDLREA